MNSGTELSSSIAELTAAAKAYFHQLYQGSAIRVNEVVDETLGWIPTMHFHVNDHLTVLVEVSENPYPVILSRRRVAVTNLSIPTTVYCVCSEDAFLDQQKDAKLLIADGFGLVTIDGYGRAELRRDCIPLIQQIAQVEFLSAIARLPQKLRARLAEAFLRYNQNAPSGAADIAEVMEGLVFKAGKEAVKKAWVKNSDVRAGNSANTLKALQGSTHMSGAIAAIGAAQGYISVYRNASHHFPKDKKQAAVKYRRCRHGFLEGLDKIVLFRDAMKRAGLSGGLG